MSEAPRNERQGALAGRVVLVTGAGRGIGAAIAWGCAREGALVVVNYLNNQAKRLKVMSLSENTSAILAWANDEGFERVFVEQLKNFASPGDILIAMSGSGNSKNSQG